MNILKPLVRNSADASGGAIRLADRAKQRQEARWGLALVIFMRLVAAIWILQGLMQWSTVLTPGQPVFETLPMSSATAVVLFAVLDLVAAVGLWLATPWGGVLWLLAATLEIFVAAAMPGFFQDPILVMSIDMTLIIVYFVLTWLAGRPSD